jgi:hypothetical protein
MYMMTLRRMICKAVEQGNEGMLDVLLDTSIPSHGVYNFFDI